MVRLSELWSPSRTTSNGPVAEGDPPAGEGVGNRVRIEPERVSFWPSGLWPARSGAGIEVAAAMSSPGSGAILLNTISPLADRQLIPGEAGAKVWRSS